MECPDAHEVTGTDLPGTTQPTTGKLAVASVPPCGPSFEDLDDGLRHTKHESSEESAIKAQAVVLYIILINGLFACKHTG